MMYGQGRTLVSMLMVVGVAVLFLLVGGWLVQSSSTVQAVPRATPTIPVTIEAPVYLVPTPGRTPARMAPPSATPRPAVAATRPKTAAPSPVYLTASGPSQVPATSFSIAQGEVLCWVKSAALPAGTTTVLFEWFDETGRSVTLVNAPRMAGPATGAFSRDVAGRAGRYRCQVSAAGRRLGSAVFTMH